MKGFTMSDYKIDKRNVEDMMGLTAMQEGMLFHYLTYPDSKQYFEQFRFRLSGKLDVEIFKAAWQVVAQTNEMLRSVIRWERLEEPVQIVLKEKDIPIRVKDFSDTQREGLPGLLHQIIEKDRNTPIDLTQAPLRITLCILGNGESEMILTFHHILYDGWSNGIVLTEFLDAYHRLSRGHEPRESQESTNFQKTRYKEFFKWYRSRGRDSARQDEFWKTCLEEFDTRTLLPYDKSKREEIRRVKTHKLRVLQDIKQRMDTCSRDHNVTPSALLYTAWGLLLQKYNNSNDIIFGTTVSGRTPAVKGIQEMVGLFINTLPLRLRADGDNTVLEVLQRIGHHLEERSDFQHSSLAEIRKFSGLGSDSDLFDSIIVIDNYPLDTILNRDGNLVIRSYNMFEMTNFDLTLQVLLVEDVDHLQVDFHYNADVFAAETIERLTQHFINVLDSISGDTAQNVSEIDMLSQEEKHRILNEFNEPEIEFLIDKTIHGVIRDQVEKTPGNRAVQYQEQWLTYGELNDQANRLAHMLAAVGVSENSRVVMMFPRSIDMIAAVLGILKAGAACIPLDMGHPDERNGFIIEDSEAGFFLKHKEVTFAGSDNANVTEIRYDPEELNAYPPDNPGRAVQPVDLSYIIYTSGSTGNPKGALLHHSGVVNHTYSKIDVLGITGKDTVANSFSINVIAAVWQILAPLFTGARLVVYSEEIEWDPYGQFQRVAADGVTIIEMIPPVLKAYLFMLEEGKEKIGLDRLRKIALTSEETKPFVVNKFYSAYPSGIDLVDCYGMTECCDDVLH
jgi:non-ribosomal peptide synthetase component F